MRPRYVRPVDDARPQGDPLKRPGVGTLCPAGLGWRGFSSPIARALAVRCGSPFFTASENSRRPLFYGAGKFAAGRLLLAAIFAVAGSSPPVSRLFYQSAAPVLSRKFGPRRGQLFFSYSLARKGTKKPLRSRQAPSA